MSISVVSPPIALPVTLEQIKQHLRIDNDLEDDQLDDLVHAATAHIEAEISQYLIDRTIRQYVDLIPANGMVSLNAWPVKTIQSVTGYDPQGTPVLLGSDEYSIHVKTDPARVGFTICTVQSDYPNGIEIDFVSGYGATGADIPSNIIRAILILCGHWYENRGGLSAKDALLTLPSGLDSLLKPVRRLSL